MRKQLSKFYVQYKVMIILYSRFRKSKRKLTSITMTMNDHHSRWRHHFTFTFSTKINLLIIITTCLNSYTRVQCVLFRSLCCQEAIRISSALYICSSIGICYQPFIKYKLVQLIVRLIISKRKC